MTRTTFALCLLAGVALAEDPAELPASQLSWVDCYGSREAEPDVVYCLLGRSQYGAPQAEGIGDAVKQWLAGHPSARAMPVWSFSTSNHGSGTTPIETQVWVWVVDGDANLCIDLVAHGFCPAGTMAIATDEEPHVPREQYDAFLAAVAKAEDRARNAGLGIWKNPELAEIEVLDRADRLREERKFNEAVVAYQEAIKLGADAEACWMSIAECREGMGEYQAALSAYDEAIATGGISALGVRAQCMSRYEGHAVGAAWLQQLIDKAPASGDKAFLWSVLGLFHMEEDRPGEALAPLRACFQMRCDEHALQFDEQDALIVDAPTDRKPAGDFLVVVASIEPLAECALRAGELDEAFRIATRGVAVMSHFRRAEGRYAADEVEAGDAACRSIRAIVLAQRGRLDEACEEQRHAALLAERSKLLSDREAADRAHRVISVAQEERRKQEAREEEKRK